MISTRFFVIYAVSFVISIALLNDGSGAEAADATCANGVANGLYCCSAGCGTCGGAGCGSRNGLNCCGGSITESCETNNAPCMMETIPVLPTDPTCANGVANGLFCCVSGCGTCGGGGCWNRNGLNCCGGTITESCENNIAPCKMETLPTTTSETPDELPEPTTANPPTTPPTNLPTTPPTTSPTTPTDPTCANGVANGIYCCLAGCGTCGGGGCGSRNGLNCCGGTITESCENNIAPCLMETPPTTTSETLNQLLEPTTTEPPTTSPTTAPTTPPTTPPTTTPPTDLQMPLTGDPTCANGVANGLSCCLAACGTCGGAGCGSRNGLNCCGGSITASCESNSAPCTMEAAPVPEISDPTCFDGVASGLFCCVLECGTCGGSGCGSRNGLNCCTGGIEESCENKSAPCAMASLPTRDATCANGVVTNNYCCPAECGTCGGADCDTRVAGIDCCTRSIETTCNSKEAPCLVSGHPLLPFSTIAWEEFGLQTWIDNDGDGRGDWVSGDLIGSEVSEVFFGGVDDENLPVQVFTTRVSGLPYGDVPRARVELRELNEWDASTGRHVFSGKLKIMHTPHGEAVSVGQVMQKVDNLSIWVCQVSIRYNSVTDVYYPMLTINGLYSSTGKWTKFDLANGDIMGVVLNYSIIVDYGVLSLEYSDDNGNTFSTGSISNIGELSLASAGRTDGFLFKAGNYLQVTHDLENHDQSTVWYYDVRVSHY